jgi:hypothetical protein
MMTNPTQPETTPTSETAEALPAWATSVGSVRFYCRLKTICGNGGSRDATYADLSALLAALPDERRASLLAEHLPRQVLINTHALATRATTAETALAEKEAELAAVKAERDAERERLTALASLAVRARALIGRFTRETCPNDAYGEWKALHLALTGYDAIMVKALTPPAVETPVADAWNSKGPVYTQRPGEAVPEQGFINRDASRVGGKETK